MNILEIKNKWNWGETIHLICEGCGLCTIEFLDGTDWGYISGLMVHESRRKQGIAKELMKRAEEIVKESGYNVIRLDVEKERKFVYELYKRLGYELYFEDDKLYKMRKNLSK